MSDGTDPPGLQPFPDSLSHRCSAVRYVQTKTSTFLMCTAPGLPKYAAQPVRECEAFREANG
jgi:hypothetical protein